MCENVSESNPIYRDGSVWWRSHFGLENSRTLWRLWANLEHRKLLGWRSHEIEGEQYIHYGEDKWLRSAVDKIMAKPCDSGANRCFIWQQHSILVQDLSLLWNNSMITKITKSRNNKKSWITTRLYMIHHFKLSNQPGSAIAIGASLMSRWLPVMRFPDPRRG